MSDQPRLIEAQTVQPYRGSHQEIAVFVRELLSCDYALVAVPGKDSIRIQGFAGEAETYPDLAAEVISRLRDWGPVVVDDARLVAAPVYNGSQLMGVLIGYSAKPGTFTAADLEKLMTYTNVALGILVNTAIEAKVEKGTFTTEELSHFSRLVTIGELSACFAHDVANPLMLINGHLHFIKESLRENHPLRKNIDAIGRASKRIEEMSKRMLDFSKKRTHRTESFNIAELIPDALRFVQPYLRKRFVDVQVFIEPELPAILADRWQLVQAIVNLLQNAIDAMADVEHRVLTILVRLEENRLKLIISDTGTGIPSDDVSKIFEPFFTTKGDQGTGLGLYITKQVVEDHCGSIDVETSDRGTSFVISLPL
jgi:signal transduction histidine kinase